MVKMSSDGSTRSQQADMIKEEAKSPHDSPVETKKGKREANGLISDVLSQYSDEHKSKKQKARHDTSCDGDSAISSSSGEEAEEKQDSNIKAKPKEEKEEEEKEEEKDQNDSESKEETKEEEESKDQAAENEFIDIEKAQYTFPERLMELLMNGTVKKAMWWLPGGEAFALVPNTFYDIVLAKYFQGTKFESFTRKLNRWGFKRLSGQGVPKGTIAYYHKLFKQDKPTLMKKMRSGKSSQNQDDTSNARNLLMGGTGLVPPTLDGSMAQLNPYLAAQLMQSNPANALWGQRAGLLAGPIGADQSLQLHLLQQQQQQQMMTQEQRMQAFASLGASQSPGNQEYSAVRRQAELLAMEEIRAAQAQEAMVRAQMQARLMQQQQAGLMLGGMGGLRPPALQQSAATEEQVRMLLLQRQLNRPGGGF